MCYIRSSHPNLKNTYIIRLSILRFLKPTYALGNIKKFAYFLLLISRFERMLNANVKLCGFIQTLHPLHWALFFIHTLVHMYMDVHENSRNRSEITSRQTQSLIICSTYVCILHQCGLSSLNLLTYSTKFADCFDAIW